MLRLRDSHAANPRFTSSRHAMLIAAMAIGGAFSAEAEAQTEPTEAESKAELTEVVVTAQRRRENLQDVPVTITAISSDTLERFAMQDLEDIAAVTPGLLFNSVVGYATPYIRGVGTSSTGPGFENPVALYVDGVYFAASGGAMLSLSNIAGIEVDKGPQGTLFGRNATAGAIQIRTLDPSHDFGGKVSASYGNYNTLRATAYLTGGLTDTIAADLSVAYANQLDGYGKDLSTGQDISLERNLTIRSKILIDVSDFTRLTLAGDYGNTQSRPALVPAPGAIIKGNRQAASNPRDAYGWLRPVSRTEQWGVSAKLEQEVGALTLMSLSAYRDTHFGANFFTTLTDDPAFTTSLNTPSEPHRQFSQEVQLQSGTGGRLEWILGGFYFWERAGYLRPTMLRGGAYSGPGGIDSLPDTTINSYSGFAQGTFAITPTTKLTAGLRYTNETKSLSTITVTQALTVRNSSRFDLRANFERVTWRLALTQALSDQATAYASYNRGFKSGGFNTAELTSFQPEILDAYEVGIKTTLLDRRLRMNVAGFYYDYTNMQVTSYPGGRRVVNNGGKSRLYGVDADFEAAATSELTLRGGIELLKSEFTDFPLAGLSEPATGGGSVFVPGSATGNALPRAPDVTFNLGANYTKKLPFGKVSANAVWNYNDGFFGDVDNRLRQPAYHIVNASVGMEFNSGVGVSFWVKNLANELYAVQLAARATGDFAQYGDPRTYGITLNAAF